MHSSVRVPMTRAGATSSVAGSFDVRRKSVSAELRTPRAITEEDGVLRDAVESRGGAEVHDDRVAAILPARRQRVDDAIRADGERLVDLQRDRQRRAGVDDLDARVRQPAAAGFGEGCRHRRHDGADGHAVHRLKGDLFPGEQTTEQHPELVGRARHLGDDPPVRAEGGTVVESQRRLGVTDVEGQEHASGSAKVSVPERYAV